MNPWTLVEAGQIRGEWRRWVAPDGTEFEWGNIDQRREALADCAEYVTVMSFIRELRNGWQSLIDERKFLISKTDDNAACREKVEAHVRELIRAQDGDRPTNRTLNERKNIYLARATP